MNTRAARFFPFLETLRGYSRADFRADLLAAVTVTPMAVPQAMAYAIIAGVHPQYGIYACMLPVALAALWGSSRYMAAGPTNAISMVIYSTFATVSVGGVLISSLPEAARMAYVFGLAVLCGLIQIGMGLARLGDLANFISHSVMVAFTTGAALLIAVGQISTVLGLTGPKPAGFFNQIFAALHGLPQANIWCLALAVLTVVLTLTFRRVSRRFPASLAALAVVTAVSALLGAGERGVPLVGAIPSVVPPLSLPPAFDLDALRDLFMPALALALLGTVESLAIGKQLANVKNDSFDGSQELIGQGLGNLAAGLTSGIPGCGSFTRSALMVSSGGRTRMGTVFSGILALPMLFLLAPLIRWLPLPALGGILLLISFKMIDVEAIRLCLVATRVDRVVLLITFLSTLLFDLEKAIFIGVLLSLVLFIYKTSHPRVRRLQPGDPLLREAPADLPDGVAVYVIEGTLFFGAIHELERQLYEEDREPARLVLLHLSRVFWLDASGAHALAQFVERCYARSMPVILVVGSSSVRNILQRTGILDYLSNGFVADTINEGLRLAATLLRRVSCRDGQCAFPMPAMPAWRDDHETDPLLSAGEAGAAAGLAPTQADQLPGPLRSAPGNAAANAAQARSNEPAPARSTPAAEARVTLTGPQPPAGGPAHPASEDAAASVVSAAPSADGPAGFVPAPQPTPSPTAASAPPAGRKSGSDPKELA